MTDEMARFAITGKVSSDRHAMERLVAKIGAAMAPNAKFRCAPADPMRAIGHFRRAPRLPRQIQSA